MSDKPNAQPEQTRTFEDALAMLEDRVRKLDSGELPLEQALATFEEGVGLVRQCQELLDGAEQRIVELTGSTDAPSEQERTSST